MIKNVLGLKITNIVMFVGTLIVNYLTTAGIGILKPIGNISDEYNTLLTPPGWAFSIWGLIYAGLFLFCICQFITQFNLDKYIKSISILFILSCLFNITWIVAFSLGTPVSITISVLLIFGLLICLLLIEKRCNFFSGNVFLLSLKLLISIILAFLIKSLLSSVIIKEFFWRIIIYKLNFFSIRLNF